MSWLFFANITNFAIRRERVQTHWLKVESACHTLDRIRLLGYRVEIRRLDIADKSARLEIHASDERTGESHRVQIDSQKPDSELRGVGELAECVAAELEG